MKAHRVVRNTTRNVGDPCSKYGYDRNGEQFNADMQAHEEKARFLWGEFVKFMKSHDVDPRYFRVMFLKYHEEFFEGQ